MSYTDKGSNNVTSYAPHFSYIEVFNKHFPYYLSIGMSPTQYWDEDCLLVKYYREAEEIKREKKNQEMWLQGMYYYEALLRVSPILRAFAKKGTKPQPYTQEPYPINQKTLNETTVKKENERKEKGLRYMQAYMISNNKKFEERN